MNSSRTQSDLAFKNVKFKPAPHPWTLEKHIFLPIHSRLIRPPGDRAPTRRFTTSVFCTILFSVKPNARKVVFDRDLLITHMVSPEGEQLQLVEPIDPKGQNVEAWMLELEGKMRLTVSQTGKIPCNTPQGGREQFAPG